MPNVSHPKLSLNTFDTSRVWLGRIACSSGVPEAPTKIKVFRSGYLTNSRKLCRQYVPNNTKETTKAHTTQKVALWSMAIFVCCCRCRHAYLRKRKVLLAHLLSLRPFLFFPYFLTPSSFLPSLSISLPRSKTMKPTLRSRGSREQACNHLSSTRSQHEVTKALGDAFVRERETHRIR